MLYIFHNVFRRVISIKCDDDPIFSREMTAHHSLEILKSRQCDGKISHYIFQFILKVSLDSRVKFDFQHKKRWCHSLNAFLEMETDFFFAGTSNPLLSDQCTGLALVQVGVEGGGGQRRTELAKARRAGKKRNVRRERDGD